MCCKSLVTLATGLTVTVLFNGIERPLHSGIVSKNDVEPFLQRLTKCKEIIYIIITKILLAVNVLNLAVAAANESILGTKVSTCY